MQEISFLVKDTLLFRQEYDALLQTDSYATFSFSKSWDDYIKVAVLSWGGNNSKESAVRLDEDNRCRIPDVAIVHGEFDLYIVGVIGKMQKRSSKAHVKVV